MSRVFCSAGIRDAVDHVVDYVMQAFPELDESVLKAAVVRAVKGRILDMAEEAARSYSWDYVQEEVSSALQNATVDDLDPALVEEIQIDARPPCPDCGTGHLAYVSINQTLRCTRCPTELSLAPAVRAARA